MSTKSAYGKAGVDVALERELSAHAYELCKATASFSPFVEAREFSSHFRGPRGFRLRHLDPRETWLDGAADGVGTKTILIDAAERHFGTAADLVAMTGGDISRWGGIPLVLFNNLEIASLADDARWRVQSTVKNIFSGLHKVAREQNIVCARGDLAQMGPCVGSDIAHSATRFNWSGVMLGAYREDRLITGTSIAVGDVIIALREDGFRSNGFSAVRLALTKKYGKRWWRKSPAQDFIANAAKPATLYDRLLAEANGWYDLLPETKEPSRVPVHAIVHITGGGIPEKFGPLLKASGFSAELTELYRPCEEMLQCAEWLGMSDGECYRVWGCGQGALIVVPKEAVERFLNLASRHQIEARAAGHIEKNRSASQISIYSRFSDAQIVFPAR